MLTYEIIEHTKPKQKDTFRKHVHMDICMDIFKLLSDDFKRTRDAINRYCLYTKRR